jgi:hypothetical protein
VRLRARGSLPPRRPGGLYGISRKRLPSSPLLEGRKAAPDQTLFEASMVRCDGHRTQTVCQALRTVAVSMRIDTYEQVTLLLN